MTGLLLIPAQPPNNAARYLARLVEQSTTITPEQAEARAAPRALRVPVPLGPLPAIQAAV
jgi:hypothetical protein